MFANTKYIQQYLKNILFGSLFILLFITSIAFTGYHAVIGNQAVLDSQTPIGEKMLFEVSQAEVTMKAQMTDRNRDVLILTMSVDEKRRKLPSSASDFWVVTTSNIVGDSVPVFFGRMSTDGDFYLIIPYPDEKITYTIGIYNTASTTGETVVTSSKGVNVDKGTQASVISDITSDIMKKTPNVTRTIKKTDTIGFNASMNSAIKNDNKYQLKTLDIDSLLIEKKGIVSFDFETFYELAYRQIAVETAQAKVDSIEQEIELVNKELTPLQETLEINPDDRVAIARQDEVNAVLASLNQKLAEASNTLSEVRKLKFKASDFDDYTTKMYKIR